MDFATIANLGIGGFAILVMWWMYQSSAAERQRHDDRADKKDAAFRALESDVRNKLAAQLMENTNAMLENTKIMERVLNKMTN
jgi:tyrosine-protein phosphatase YwqE